MNKLIYRAVGEDEYLELMNTNQFAVLDGGVDVKYFGMDLNETIEFANKRVNRHVVAIFEVLLPLAKLNKLGDFTDVDPFLFKNGSVEIAADNLNEFNQSIIRITHRI